MSETYDAALRRGAAHLAAAGIDHAAGDARAMMRWAAGCDAARLTMKLRDPAPEAALVRYNDALDMRAGRRPVSHIVGGRLFWGRWFEVTPDVLDPRPETEIMVARALDLPPPERVLELGVGSACILGAVLAECPEATGLGTDLSPEALEVAKANAAALGLTGRAGFERADWCQGLAGGFDLIASNPPYIALALRN